MTQTPAGWYPDPGNPGGQRYWDGVAWTEHYAPANTAAAVNSTASPVGAKPPWWRRWWAISVGVVLVLIIVGNLFGSGGQPKDASADASGDPTPASPSATTKSSTPSKSVTPKATPKSRSLNPGTGVANRVRPGAAFQLGDFKVLKGWRIHNVGYGLGYEINNLEVQNTTGDNHAFSVDVKLHQGAHRIVAQISCFADEAHPQDIVSVDCFPDGDGKRYDYVTIENSF